MNDTISKKRGSSALLIVLVVFVFMVCSLFLILYGANVYSNITSRSDADFSLRMRVSYITNKIRSCDTLGGVHILPGGGGVLLCENPETEVTLYTYIYHYGGYIMECITDDPDDFYPENGETVIEASSLYIREIPGGLSVTVGTDTGEIIYTVSLRSS